MIELTDILILRNIQSVKNLIITLKNIKNTIDNGNIIFKPNL